MKRAFDIFIGGTVLVALSPILLVLAVLILISMGRPIMFKQWRAGMDGKAFQMWKFRTMRDGAGSDGDRMTKVGKFLRSTSLDELPELVNVVKGDMSLVGPRPLHLYYLGRYTQRQARRHEVRPGVTGLAQVSGRNTLTWADRFELDVQYVEGVTLRLDLRILFETLRTVVRREGISSEDNATMREFAGRLVEMKMAQRTADIDLPSRTADIYLPTRTANIDLTRRTGDAALPSRTADVYLPKRTAEHSVINLNQNRAPDQAAALASDAPVTTGLAKDVARVTGELPTGS